MATKIILLNDPQFPLVQNNWAGAEFWTKDQLIEAGKTGFSSNPQWLVVGSRELLKDSLVSSALEGIGKSGIGILLLSDLEDASFLPLLSFLGAESRGSGVKECLKKGSTIYSDSIFNSHQVGEKIDSVQNLSRGSLSPLRALESWGLLNALAFLGLRSLPDQGEAGSGDKVDIQVGKDENLLAISVRFPCQPAQFSDLRQNGILSLAREAADFFELRLTEKNNQAEFLGLFFLTASPRSVIECQSRWADLAMEKMEEVKEYQFRSLGAIQGKAPKEKRVIKGGFKKKFSEAVAIKDEPSVEEKITVSAEQITNAEQGNFLVKAEALKPLETTTIKGATEVKKDEVVVVKGAAAPQEKSSGLLESKIQSLETTLKQREELIVKLNKEIEEIKDPMKMGVISSIKDNQVEGLKANITRLQKDIEEGQNREREMLSVVDKAVQIKDEAIKKLKDLEAKLRASQGGTNSKQQMLEKQMEEQKRQNKELSKRVTALTEQLLAAGKKVA
jgi:chromosome segregation ATPase